MKIHNNKLAKSYHLERYIKVGNSLKNQDLSQVKEIYLMHLSSGNSDEEKLENLIKAFNDLKEKSVPKIFLPSKPYSRAWLIAILNLLTANGYSARQ